MFYKVRIIISLIILGFAQAVYANGGVDYVEYNKKHIEVVESGIKPIISFYKNGSVKEKRALLLCLDKYLDPYYQYDLPYSSEIFSWLNAEINKVPNIKVKEDFFQLLQSYSDLGYDDCELSENGKVVCEAKPSNP